MQSVALPSNRMSYVYVFDELNISCADSNNFHINRGIFLLLEIIDVLDRTDYHAKLIDIADFQRSVVKHTHALTCAQESEWSEVDSKLKTDNGTLNKTNIANIASQSSVPQHVLIAYGKTSTHSILYKTIKYVKTQFRSRSLLPVTTEANLCSQQELESKTQQDERLAPKKQQGVFEIKNRAGNVGATSYQRHP